MNQIPRQIETRVIFLRIGDINTVKERFFAEILVESRWEEPKLVFEFKKTELKEKEITNYKKYWNPNIYVENVLDDSNQTVHYQAKKKRNLNIKFPNGQDENQTEAKYWIYEYKKIKGFFFQKLMLKYFPLDVQDLSIVLTTYKSSNEVLLVQNKENLSIIGSSLTIDKNIWHLYKHVEVVSNFITDENFDNNSNGRISMKFPLIVFQCKVSRRAGYYFWNAYFLIFLITTSIFAIFAVNPKQTYYRLAPTAKLLLTSIVFKWSFSGRCLPTVNYLTSLDVYSIESIVLIFLCFIWHGVITIFLNLYDKKTVDIIDKSMLGFIFLLFIFVNLTLLIWSLYALKIRKLMKNKDRSIARSSLNTNHQNKLNRIDNFSHSSLYQM